MRTVLPGANVSSAAERRDWIFGFVRGPRMTTSGGEWTHNSAARWYVPANTGPYRLAWPANELRSSSWRKRYSSFPVRSEEHTSELQSLTNLVCRLLLEKKKKKT